jgi:subtilisin family serine protease
MGRHIAVCIVLLGSMLTPSTGFNLPGDPGETYREGELLVRFKRGCTPADKARIAADLGAAVKHRFALIDAEQWRITGTSVAGAIERYASDPRIEYIEPNYRIYLDATYPDDPRFSDLWAMYNRGEAGGGRADADIDATDAWDIETGDDVIVGVCDSGVDYNHEDLAANIYVNPNEIPGNGVDDDGNGYIDDVHGWDFGDDDNDPMDENGHGSHVAGTIAAVGNNGVGVAGVNWRAKILPLKIVNSQGSGFVGEAVLAIAYAVARGARVTNHSWGTSDPSAALENAITAAQNAGVLTVTSAGNSGVEVNDINQHYPAGLPQDGIVTVANTTRDDRLAGSSNWSPVNVDLAAPGTGIVSTTPGNHYESFTGTSMSAPHVTGAIALIWARAPYLSWVEVKQLLIDTVDPLPDLEGKTVSGGRLNLYRALASLDDTAPSAVGDLSAALASPTSAALEWTASGDDGMVGKAGRYDLRYSARPIDEEADFAAATRVFDVPPPQTAGSTESFVVSGLAWGTTYHFALRVLDASGNASALSNPVTLTTRIADPPPAAQVTPSSLVKTLVTGTLATRSFSIVNSGTGDLEWGIRVRDGGFVPGFVVADGDVPRILPGREADELGLAPPIGATEGFLHGVRVLFDASHGQVQDRWNVIIADLEARGATVTFNADPVAAPALDTTDVLWFTDVPPPASISSEEASAIARWVRGGGGLLLEGDDDVTIEIYDRILSGLNAGIEYSPVDGQPGVSTGVHPHQITTGVGSLLFDQNGAHLSRVAAPAMVLIGDAAGTPAAAVADIGSGRVAALADELCGDSRAGAEDNRHFANRLFGWLAGSFWVSADPMDGSIAPGESADVEVTFDARGRPGGIYQAELLVDSNDPASPTLPVSATLGVTAAPDIAVSHADIAFGDVFTAVTTSKTLAVYNAGEAPLTVYTVDVPGAEFSVDVTEFTLEPEEGREIVVSVLAGAPGPLTTTLSLSSSDPDESMVRIPVTAEAFDPPVISAAPDSLHESRFGDEVVTRILTLSNDGEYDLTYSIVVEDTAGGTVPAGVSVIRAAPRTGAPVSAGEMLVATGGATGPEYLGPPVAGANPGAAGLIIFGDDFEDGDYEGWEDFGEGRKEVTDQTAAGGSVFSYHEYDSPAGHFNGVARNFGAARPAYVSFYIRPGATDQADSYVLLDDSGGRHVTYVYCSSGGTLCVNAGNPGQDCSIAYEAGRWYFVELQNIDFDARTFDYYVDHALIAEEIPFMSPADDIAAMQLYNYFQGSQAWWDQIVVASKKIVTWLTLDPALGVVPPHASVDVEVRFDATQLFTGTYDRLIVISSNDPTTPEERVPVTFDVTAVPNLAVSDTLIDFGREVVGFSRTIPLRLINRSLQENLVVSNIVVDNPAFAVDQTSATLPPGGTSNVLITFTPEAHGPTSGVLTVESNDRDEPLLPVALTGQGVDAPVVSILPDSIRVDIPAGGVSVESLLVSNVAANPEAANLEFSLWVQDDSPLNWITLSPKLGSVAPGSTAVVTATFDAAGLIEGDFPAHVDGTVNVPNTGILRFVETTMHVIGSAHMALADTLDFGTVYSGFPAARLLNVKNVGSANLVVTDIVCDQSVFTAAPASFTLAPEESTGVSVTMVPAGAGPVSATLTVASNDTAGAHLGVTLTAEVLEAPSASVSNDSIFVSVRQTRKKQETITLRNNGQSELVWRADLDFARDTAPLLDAASSKAGGGPAAAPDVTLIDVLWYGSHGPLGIDSWATAIADIHSRGGEVTQSNEPMTAALLDPYDILWLGDADDVFTPAERDAIVEWVGDGGSLLIEANNATAVTSYQPVLDAMGSGIHIRSSSTPSSLVITVYPHETTNGVSSLQVLRPKVFIYELSPPAGVLAGAGQTLTTAAHSTAGRGRVVVVTDWPFSDLLVDAPDNRRFMRQVFGWLSGTNWLAVAPLEGSVAAGGQSDIVVTFEPGDLPAKDYIVQLDIASNDPSRPVIAVPLAMQVQPLVPRHVDLALEPGLNLRSWNVELAEESTATVVSSIIDAVESIQGFDGGGLTFDPSIPPRFNTLKTMDHYHGYWFRMSQAATLSLDGVGFDHRTPLPLAAGYNLVGYFPESPDSTAHAIESVITNTDVVLGYDGGGLTFDPSIPPQFNTLRTLQPGFGYWIRLARPDTLVYPDAPAQGVVAIAPADRGVEPDGGTVVALAEAPGGPADLTPSREWIGVWGANVRIEGKLIEAGTEVKAIDGDGTVCGRCTAHHPGQFGLMAVYGDDPETDVDEGAGVGEIITVLISDRAFTGVEWSGMGAVIDFDEVARTTAAADGIPARNDLRQNFPNPFNPTTTIAYDLASGEVVTLAIFDVRGKRVRELVNGAQPPGRYRVDWDGRDERGQRVAGGVYFYRLEAGSYTKTRKMVLLK